MEMQPPVLSDADILRVRGQASPTLAPSGPRVIEGTRPPREPPAQTTTQAEIDRIRAERDRLQLERDQRNAADPAGESPATQRRDAGFYLRATRSNGLYEQHQVDPRGVVGQTLADAFPRIANANASPERQMAEAAQADFIGATLRYESGAAVPPAEFEMQRARYFPQPGDSPEVIAFKAQLRRNAIEALQRSAGPAANGIDSGTQGNVNSDAATVTNAAAAQTSVGGAALSVPTGGPTPPPPNDGITRTDPRESGAASGVTQQPNQEIAGSAESGTMYAGPLSNRFNSEWQAAVNHGATREQLDGLLRQQSEQLTQAYHMLAPLFPGIDFGQHVPTSVSDDMWRTIEEGRRTGRMPNFTPGALDPQPGSGMGRMLGDSGTAGVANALDSASFGLPALVSEDFRNRLGNMRENHPVASTVGALVGGLVAPGGPRPGMSLLEQSGRSAAQGAAYGFNESGGDPANALAGGAIGGAAPGAFNLAGRGVRAARNALLPSANYLDQTAQDLALAAQQENVRVSRPILDPSSRDRMAYLESSRGSGNIVREGLANTASDIENRAAQLGAGGTAEATGTMGTRVQQAGQRYIRESGQRASRMYDRASTLAGDTQIRPRDAVAEIDSQLARLRRNPGSNSAEINFLEGLRGDFVDANGNLIPKTVADIRDIRTGLRGRISNSNLTHSQVEGRVQAVLDRARGDIERDLGGANAPAVQAYRNADRFYAERQTEIRNVIQQVIGRRDANLSGEQVMARIQAMAGLRGDHARLAQLWSRLSPDEALDAAATIAENVGRKSADDPFSPAQFAQWAGRLSPDARRTIFGPQGAQSIGNLQRLSRALQQTERRLNNSQSGKMVNWRAAIREVTGGGIGGTVLGIVGGSSPLTTGAAGATLGALSAGTGIAIRRLSARTLMSPNVSRWLANSAAASSPSVLRSQLDRLQVIARAERNPVVAQEILGLRQTLLNAVNDNAGGMTRAAASPGNNEQQSQ